jgi:hypothetical protein
MTAWISGEGDDSGEPSHVSLVVVEQVPYLPLDVLVSACEEHPSLQVGNLPHEARSVGLESVVHLALLA